ncbi:MAG: L-threonylcarbamoyladenylate synthase [Bacteriovoracaceae bacterium]
MSDQKSIFIYPTDTVWGIGASFYDEKANRHIRTLKDNEALKPMSLLFENHDELESFLVDSTTIQRFSFLWSYGLTLLIPKEKFQREVPKWIIADSDFVGVRVVTNPSIKKLHSLTKFPITTTSCNPKGESPAVNSGEAQKFLNSLSSEDQNLIQMIQEGSEIENQGAASTIVKVDDSLTIIREGKNFQTIQNELGIEKS